MEIKKAKIMQNYFEGVITGESVKTSVKYLKDARCFYQNGNCDLSDDTIMYEVYSYSEGNPETLGNLNWGLTVMKPVCINEECNITRGHFHKNLNCSEIYFCLGGEGLLLLMDENNVCFAEKMSKGSIHHIDGRYAHRLVNIGSVDLKVGACWLSVSGHDYERVEKHPFTCRIFKHNGEIIVKEKE